MGLGPLVFTRGELVEGPRVVFHIFDLPISITVVTTWVIIALVFIICKIGTKKLELVPSKRQLIFESIYNFLDSIIGQILGVWKDTYSSYIGGLFIFIFLSNIVSFFPIPWLKFGDNGIEVITALRTPTADLNTTVGLALITTVTFIGTSIKFNGLSGYLKGFASPNPVITPLNIVGELAKPINISMRLFGNMFAGGVIMGIFYFFVPWVVPSLFHLYFDLVSGLVQSFVFVLLTMVYISGGLPAQEQ